MANDILVKIGADITQFSKAMEKANKSVKEFGDKNKETFDAFKGVGTAVTAGGVAIAAGLGAAVKQATSFDTSMRKAGAIAGATKDEFDAMKAAAIKLGADTSKSAGEVADAMTEMAAKGFDATQVIAAMPGVIAASEASGESLALTADTVSSALNVWALEAGEAGRVADVLATSANVSAAGIDDLGYVLKYAGAPAAALGISLEELAAAAGLMTDAGLDGSNAGTSLRASLLALNNPAKAQQKIMDELGFSMRDSEGNAKSLSDMIRDMTKATEGMTEAEKVATLGKLVGTEAVSGFLALMKAGPDAIDKNTAALEDSAGASQEAADKMMSGIGGALEEMSGAFESAAILIGDQLVPYVQAFAEKIGSLVDKFNEASPAFQKFAVLGTAVMAGLMLIVGPILLLIGFIPQIIAGFTAVKTVLLATKAAMLKLNLAMLANPIVLVIAAIALLVAAFIWAYNNVEWFRDGVHETWAQIKEAFNAALAFVSEIVTKIMSEVTAFFGEQLAKIQAFWDENGAQIVKYVKFYLEATLDFIKMTMGIIVGIFQILWPIITNVVKVAWEFIKMSVSNGIDLVLGIIRTVMALLQGDWEGAWSAIKETAEKIWSNTQKFFENVDLYQIGKDIINGLIKGIGSMVSAVGTAVKNIGTKIKDTFTGFFKVKSPSRVMMAIAKHLPGGIIKGMDAMHGKLTAATARMSEALVPDVPAVTMAYATPSGSYESLSGAVNGSVDVNASNDMLAGAIASLERKLTDLRVEMDGREVGHIVAPTVSEAINGQANGIARGRGRRRI